MTLLELPTIRRGSESPLIGTLLAEQQTLTAVERFARAHESQHFALPQDRLYRDLIPLSAPAAGEQYGFSVDLDSCSGCKACVTACHSLNGLDAGETFRDVGGLMGRDANGLHVLQHVTTACHHCVEPACLSGCPTRAYDKDPVTGIVRHLDDQCIGCQYCVLMCPYDVPKYNPLKGIVRKCDMCRQRLVDGEAPACVQACPNQAIRIEIVRTSEVRVRAETNQFLPQAPDPRLTLPATRYVTTRAALRDVEAMADPERPAHAHLPLVFMLVLTQMSIGMFIAAEGLLLAGSRPVAVVIVAALIGLAGLLSALLHLGRPQIAYRAWLGWRTSWMSREIIAFHAWIGLAAIFVLALMLPASPLSPGTLHGLGIATAVSGSAALLCSAMVYVATRREMWNARRTIPRFAVTAVLLGLAGALAISSLSGAAPVMLAGAVILASLIRLMTDTATHEGGAGDQATEGSRASDLLSGSLSNWNFTQAFLALLGGIVLPVAMLELPRFGGALAIASAVILVLAELIHRGLFFAAAAAPRMPGVTHA